LLKEHLLLETQSQKQYSQQQNDGVSGWRPPFYALMDDSIENIFVETRNFVNLSTSSDLYQAQHFSINSTGGYHLLRILKNYG